MFESRVSLLSIKTLSLICLIVLPPLVTDRLTWYDSRPLSVTIVTPLNVMSVFTTNVNSPDFSCTRDVATLSPWSGTWTLPALYEQPSSSTVFLGDNENLYPPGMETDVNCLKTSIISELRKISVGITTCENSLGDIKENRNCFKSSSPMKLRLFSPFTVMLASSHLFAAQRSKAWNKVVSFRIRADDRLTNESKSSYLTSRNDSSATITSAL